MRLSIFFSKLLIFYILVIFSLLLLIFFVINTNNISISTAIRYLNKNVESIEENYMNGEEYNLNRVWTINNNIIQYSSYIIVEEGKQRIEVIMKTTIKNEKLLVNKTDFKLMVKSMTKNEIIAEIEVDEAYNIYGYSKKIVVNLNESIKIDNVEDLALAVVLKREFRKNLKDIVMQTNDSFYVFDYKMIKFQIPSILYSIEPRIKGVASCVQYVYQVPNSISNWIDMQNKFGVKEIALYDATPNNSLTKLIESKNYGSLINVKPYYMSKSQICNFKNVHHNADAALMAEKLCNKFYDDEIKGFRGVQNEGLTTNDCFIELGQKYEFLTLYDLDEVVFPRIMNLTKMEDKKAEFNCNHTESNVCNNSPFSISLYDYIMKLVDKYFKHDISKLHTISFDHALFFKQEDIQKTLFVDLKSITKNLKRSGFNIQYPIQTYLNRTKTGISFFIEKNDVSYVEYLVRIYEFLECFYEEKLKNANIEKDFLRFIFFITPGFIRMGKGIYYSKNVLVSWTHWAGKVKANTYHFHAPAFEGHIVGHYRGNPTYIYVKNASVSIRNLFVDFEYMIYVLKDFTNYCEKNFKQH